MAGYTPGHLDRDDSKAFIARMMRRQHRSLSAGQPSWVGQHTPEEMQEFIAGRMRLAALCRPAAQPVGASAVVEQASATVGGRGGDASPVSPAYSSGTIDLGLDDLDDEVGTHPVSSTVGGRAPPDSPPEAPIPPPRPPPISSPAGSSEPWRRGSTPEIRHLLRTHAEGVLMIQACLRRAQANSFTMLHLLCGPAMDEMVRPPLGFRLPPHTRMGIGARTRARSACPGQRRPPAREAPMLAWFCSGLSPRCSSDRVKGGEELSRPSGTACTQNTAP